MKKINKMYRPNSFDFPQKSTALDYILSPIIVFNDENELWETKVGTTQHEMPLHYTVHGKTEVECRKRAKKLLNALTNRNNNIFTYQIYVLKNPLNNEIFYVGKTNQALELRLREHIIDVNLKWNNNIEKKEYIKDIISKGGMPIIEPIEVIEGTCLADENIANERELFWINHYKSIGIKIFNVKKR